MLRKNIFLEPLLTTVSISSVNVSLFKNPFPSPSQWKELRKQWEGKSLTGN